MSSRLYDWAFVLFVVAGLTDAADGKLARMMNVTSKMGRIMDPLADKVLVSGAFISFAIIGKPVLFDFPDFVQHLVHWLTVAIIISRDIYITIIRDIAERRGINFAATLSGKLKTFLQFFVIGTILIKAGHLPQANWANWFTIVALIIMLTATIVSCMAYHSRYRKSMMTKQKG
jgi:CDP-diacylglycerol--glycerol-3-phosphate 3-phosphatidyltransferase